MFPLVLKALKTFSYTLDTLTDFFWDFHGKLELAKVRIVHPEVTVFGGQFYQEAQIFFNETFWCVNNKPCILKQKLGNLKENDTFFGESEEAIWTTIIYVLVICRLKIQ